MELVSEVLLLLLSVELSAVLLSVVLVKVALLVDGFWPITDGLTVVTLRP